MKLLLLCLVVLLIAMGCGDEDPAVAPEPPFPASRATPESLLTSWYETAYTRQNLSRFGEMLAPDFRFQFTRTMAETLQARQLLPEDSTTWEKSREIAITDQIFRSPRVLSTTLDIFRIRSNVPDSTCEGCRRLEVDIRLWVRIAYDPESIVLGGDLLQTFVVGPDPEDAGAWVLRYQMDDQYLDKRFDTVEMSSRQSASAVAPDSWSWIKALFLLGRIS